jgi:RHS repeat-associated protein
MFATMVNGRVRPIMLALLVLVGLLGSALAVVAAPQAAHAEITGSGGQYVPMTKNARVFDGATVAKSFKTIQVAGVGGLPSSGIGAVTMMITVADTNGQGQFVGRPDASQPNTELLIYGAGVSGNISNSSLLAVSSSGSMQIQTETAQTHVIIDVTGYYTSTANGVGAGGFVPISAAKVADTRDGTGGVKKAQLGGGDSVTFSVAGTNGIPTGAAAVQASLIVINRNGNPGWVRPSPSGGTKSTGVLNYPGITGNTAMSAQVALGSDGKLVVDNASGGGVLDLEVVIQGYFLPSNPGGGFTPQTGRLIDTRNTTSVTSGSTVAVKVAGARSGVPSMQDGLSAVAITLTAVNGTTSQTVANVYADGSADPGVSAMNSMPNSIETTTVIVGVGANGSIRIKNVGPTTMNYVVDLQGTYTSLPGGPSTTNLTGSRPSATNLSFPIDDRTSAQVDVATGNLLLSTSALTLTGVTDKVSIGAAYNSRGWEAADSGAPDANKWSYAFDGAGSLANNATGVVYTGPDGSTWQFTDNADGSFTAPAGLQATLAKASSEYTLTSQASNKVIHFNFAGQPTSVVDRNSHSVPFTYGNYLLTKLVTTAGPSTGRTASVAYSNGTTTVSQTDGTNTRKVSWSKDSTGNITSFTDAAGKTTTFAYSGTDLTSVTAPEGGKTTFTYNGSDQVTEVDQPASAGTAATRLSYVSGTETQVASPDTDSSKTVAAVPHTDYTIDASTHNVTKAVDPDGNTRSATYNAANNGVATSTTGTGTSGSTSTNTYGANSKQSLTQVQSPTGGSATAKFDGSQANAAYLPQSTSSASGNTTSYKYDGSGNQMSSTTGGDANPSTATLTRNTTDAALKGVVTAATAPANAAAKVSTTYSYDSNQQLSTVTPPSGTINPTSYTYDGYGRVATVKDGNGTTTAYTYDNDDRTLSESFSDGTGTVTDTYDGNGNELTSQSATGTITNTYDGVNRLLSTQNSAGGDAITYTYDAAGNEVTTADAQGTVSYSYDAANVLWSMTYPHGSGTETDRYKIDDHGRRTDAYVNAGANAATTTNATNTQPASFTGHTNTAYDASNRPSEVTGWTGQDATKVLDTKYSYTTSNGADSDQLQTATDTLTGKVTTYGYVDQAGNKTTHLTGVTQTGGSGDVNWAFTYDANGNRLTSNETGAATFSQTLTFNAANQITTSGYSYDGAGNLTASPGASYAYNGAEQMTSSTVNGVKTTYAYAGASQAELLSETTAGGPAYNYTYGRTDGTGVLEIDTETTNGTSTSRVLSDAVTGQALDLTNAAGSTAAFLVDGIGNQVGALTDTGTNAFQVSYDPYGTATVSSGSTGAFWTQNPYGFKAGIRTSDAQNQLVKFGLRWYLTAVGSWTQRDTLDSPLDPANANRYAYAGDDPINNGDPTGRSEYQSRKASTIATTLGIAAVGFTAFGFPEVGIGLGIASSAFSVASRLEVGDTSGAVAAGVLGAATAGYGGAGVALGVEDATANTIGAGIFGGIETATGAAQEYEG